MNEDTLYAAAVDAREDIPVRDIQPLFRVGRFQSFAVMPGDSLFVVSERAQGGAVAQPVVAVLSFGRLLEARFGGKR